jgi:hypothetical protein
MRSLKMIAVTACISIVGSFSANAGEMEDSMQLVKLPKDIEKKMLINYGITLWP